MIQCCPTVVTETLLTFMHPVKTITVLADSMKRLHLHLGKLVHETIINLALLQQALLAIPSPGKLITANTFSWQQL